MEITALHPVIIIVVIIVVALVRYAVEKAISSGYRRMGIERRGVQVFIKSVLLIIFNGLVLVLFGLANPTLFSLSEVKMGTIIVAIGLGLAILVALLTYFAVKAGYGSGYGTLAKTSKLDKFLTLLTFILLVGLAEDLFFLGFAQNALTGQLGWGAIIAYLGLFIGYHFANVISGVESRAEFLGALPVRVLVSVLLATSFYRTNSLLYGLIVHNMVDTLSYIALLLAVAPAKKDTATTPV